MTEEYRKILDNIKKEMDESSKQMSDGLNALIELWNTSDCAITNEDIKKSFYIISGKQINQTELFDVLDGLHKTR